MILLMYYLTICLIQGERFSYKSLTLKVFTFRPIIQFELIFVYSTGLFVFISRYPIIMETFDEKLSFLHGISFALLLKTSYHIREDSVLCFPDSRDYYFTDTTCFDYRGFTTNLKN